MKTINKLFSAIFLFIVAFAYADTPVMPPPGEDDTGVVGPGTPASPIDMYIIGLVVIAIMMTVFFAKKYKTQKI
ncbi:signal peptidase [Chryseobacterium sp. MYb7]|jgi:hypothetical protein|uniref:signal peptidase n=1 Tax=Chryseobacterium sp. MYb7 TaxID=1827290 RepID=UPI000D00C6FF|nr:signal peptidase [Chryseobacterium sp. MYb7]PRB01024.1 signal peptidase [Chryseobacterium sp. MYb7]